MTPNHKNTYLYSKKVLLCLRAMTVLALTFSGCQKADSPEAEKAPQAAKKKGGIVLTNNTALRIDPFIFSGCISRLEKGQPVEVIGKSAEKSMIGGGSDYWYHIRLKDGISGWLYGKNLRIINIKNQQQMDDIVSSFWNEESVELTKDLVGKWWSVNHFGDFTRYGLELYPDNKYRSYTKDHEDRAIEGKYNFDLSKNEIIFPEGTSFRKNLKFARRGQSYTLFVPSDDSDIRFKRIQTKIETPEETEKKEGNENKNK